MVCWSALGIALEASAPLLSLKHQPMLPPQLPRYRAALHDAYDLASELTIDDRPPRDKRELAALSTMANLPLDNCTVALNLPLIFSPSAVARNGGAGGRCGHPVLAWRRPVQYDAPGAGPWHRAPVDAAHLADVYRCGLKEVGRLLAGVRAAPSQGGLCDQVS